MVPKSLLCMLLVPILSLISFAGGMAVISGNRQLLSQRLLLPPALGDPGPYILVGGLGVVVLICLGSQELRIRELEKQLRDRDGPG